MDFEAFVAAHGDQLVRFAFLLCHDRGRAEDLVQEALFKADRRWAKSVPVEFPVAYVRRIVITEYLGWRRRLSSSEVIGLDDIGLSSVPDAATGIAEQDAVWRALALLPARQRAVLVLRYYEDLDDDAIAALLGCARATVRSLAARALDTLRSTNPPIRRGHQDLDRSPGHD